MRRAMVVAVVAAGLAALVGLAVWWPSGDPDIDRDTLGYADRVHATVTSASAGPCAEDPTLDCVVGGARLTSGPESGGTATITTTAGSETVYSLVRFRPKTPSSHQPSSESRRRLAFVRM